MSAAALVKHNGGERGDLNYQVRVRVRVRVRVVWPARARVGVRGRGRARGDLALTLTPTPNYQAALATREAVARLPSSPPLHKSRVAVLPFFEP